MTEVLPSSTETFVGDFQPAIVNTPDAKAAKEIIAQFLNVRLGKPVKNIHIRKEVELLLKLSKEVETRHELVLNNMCNKLRVNEDNAHEAFFQVSEEIFKGGCNWGRIIVLFSFGAKLAEYCEQNCSTKYLTEKIPNWLFVALLRRMSWIKEEGRGWNGFMDKFRDAQAETEKTWFQGLFAATVGLGALAATLYIKS